MRAAEVEKIQQLVGEGQANGGHVLVIPARTISHGPEAEYLDGYTFELGTGFAPSPEFTEWVEAQIVLGAQALDIVASPDAKDAEHNHHHHHHH